MINSSLARISSNQSLKYIKVYQAFIQLLNIILLFSCFQARAELAAVSSTLNNVSEQISIAVNRAKQFYETNGGQDMSGEILLLVEGQSHYLQELTISKKYKIKIKLIDNAPNSSANTAFKIPITASLKGKRILIVPISNPGDERINSFECVTDADHDVQEFEGDAGNIEGNKSFITTSIGDKGSPYLGMCNYITLERMNELYNDSDNP